MASKALNALPWEETAAYKHELDKLSNGAATSVSTLIRSGNTDVGNAERLVARHGADLRYVGPWKKWLTWDKLRWRLDELGEVIRRAKETARAIALEEARQCKNDKQFDDRLRWSRQSLNSKRIRAMIELAQSEKPIPILPEHLDIDPWLLNCANGTLDLKTGTLRPHDRADLLTKLTPIIYDPDTECPTWDRFLREIFEGNADLIWYLQKAIGYSLTGLTTEQCLFLLHGLGANGKSTFLRILMELLADYAEQADMSSFLHKDRATIRNDLAKLRGARFVSAVESGEGRRLDEVTIKQLTGGDQITVRFLHAEFFTYTPAFKIWLAANHKPVIRGTDHAMWRRIHLIPFNVTFENDKQDKNLFAKLRAELPGILRWSAYGCQAWQEEGLRPPEAVLAATASYRSEMDILGGFFDEYCLIRTDLQVPSSDLYSAYQLWSKQNGVKDSELISQTAFANRMKDRGLINGRNSTTGKKVWRGIGLRQKAER